MIESLNVSIPVTVYKARVDIITALHAPEGLQAHPRGLEGQDVDQPVLELVYRQVRRHKPKHGGTLIQTSEINEMCQLKFNRKCSLGSSVDFVG